jgi:hypothetical protein
MLQNKYKKSYSFKKKIYCILKAKKSDILQKQKLSIIN